MKHFAWLPLLFAVLLPHFPSRAAETPSSEEALQITAKVYDIFAAKCLDCHGADLARPKGKFGYVLDLARISAEPKYVVKGEPENSDIYTLVRDDEMPGDDAKVPGLTPEEKETVRKWVAIGAPGTLPKDKAAPTSATAPAVAGAAAPTAAPTAAAAAAAPQIPFLKQLVRWLGHFHAVSTHFPVALLMVALVAEALAFVTRRESWMTTIRFLVYIAALGAVGAAVLGWFNAAFAAYGSGSSASILLWHRWLGTFTAFWACVCAGLLLAHDCPEGSRERARFRAALFIGAVLVGVSGFLGSALIYGLDHYSWN
jgi:uncharacterized membrane protein